MNRPKDIEYTTRTKNVLAMTLEAIDDDDHAEVCVRSTVFEPKDHELLRKLGEWCIEASGWLKEQSKRPSGKGGAK